MSEGARDQHNRGATTVAIKTRKARMGLTIQAQRPGARDATMATATLPPGSLHLVCWTSSYDPLGGITSKRDLHALILIRTVFQVHLNAVLELEYNQPIVHDFTPYRAAQQALEVMS